MYLFAKDDKVRYNEQNFLQYRTISEKIVFGLIKFLIIALTLRRWVQTLNMSVSKLQLGREGETGQVISTTVSDADNEFKYKETPIQ